MARFSMALARPGMDTRLQSSLAFAKGESFVDEKSGVFVDVMLAPSGEQVTARVAPDYAGKGFGFYAPVHVDDELLVVLPNGEQAEGAVVVRRLWSQADPPPTDAVADPTEVMLVVEKDRNLRLRVSGTGVVEVNSEAKVIVTSPTILLGSKDSAEPVPLGNVLADALNKLVADPNGILSNAAGAFMSPMGPCFVSPTVVPIIQQWVQTYLTGASTNILSGKAATER